MSLSLYLKTRRSSRGSLSYCRFHRGDAEKDTNTFTTKAPRHQERQRPGGSDDRPQRFEKKGPLAKWRADEIVV